MKTVVQWGAGILFVLVIITNAILFSQFEYRSDVLTQKEAQVFTLQRQVSTLEKANRSLKEENNLLFEVLALHDITVVMEKRDEGVKGKFLPKTT